jgi:hypothetical protein
MPGASGLLLPGEHKSMEHMAARLAPGNVRRTPQSLHHLVADGDSGARRTGFREERENDSGVNTNRIPG